MRNDTTKNNDVKGKEWRPCSRCHELEIEEITCEECGAIVCEECVVSDSFLGHFCSKKCLDEARAGADAADEADRDARAWRNVVWLRNVTGRLL